MQSYKVCEKGTIKGRYTEGVIFREKWYIKGKGAGPRGGASPYKLFLHGRYSHGNYFLYECYVEAHCTASSKYWEDV